MVRRKAKIIKDKKARGEWAESIFLARAAEHDLPVSKPWGDSESFDCVVGRPGKFVAVQVKSTVAELAAGTGYSCSVCSSGRPYRTGSFDFLAAFVVPEEAWYLIPAKGIVGMKSLSLCTEGGKYEKYREAWHLLKEATKTAEETESGEPGEVPPAEVTPPGPRFPRNAFERMEAAFNMAQRRMEGGAGSPRKTSGET